MPRCRHRSSCLHLALLSVPRAARAALAAAALLSAATATALTWSRRPGHSPPSPPPLLAARRCWARLLKARTLARLRTPPVVLLPSPPPPTAGLWNVESHALTGWREIHSLSPNGNRFFYLVDLVGQPGLGFSNFVLQNSNKRGGRAPMP